MADDAPKHDGHHFDPVVAPEYVHLAQTMWQAPTLMTTAWWNAMLDAYQPHEANGHRHVDPHDQLIVPQPIAAEGEHGLFA
jgi:hypothetical protein